jgi:hypothetical protein
MHAGMRVKVKLATYGSFAQSKGFTRVRMDGVGIIS